jgi:LPXTG-motif cell wall-anchored protein
MAKQLERNFSISPVRAILAAGGLALLLLLGVASPASAQDYPTPTTSPATSVDVTEVSQSPELPRTGSDNTAILVVVGAGVLMAGTALVLVSKRQHAKHPA